jgi:hypothetical protein
MVHNNHIQFGGEGLTRRYPASQINPSEDEGANHILIIDDSHRICSVLATSIVNGCAASGQSCQIIQSGPFGLIETIPMNFSDDVFDTKILTLYLADSTKHALAVVRLPSIKRLTIICDIIMPGDTEVGLFGLLTELASLQLPVNLLFASSEGQNRYYVEQLIGRHKAYFVEKGTAAWGELPVALVHRSHMFQYQLLSRPDFDKGRLQSQFATGRLVAARAQATDGGRAAPRPVVAAASTSRVVPVAPDDGYGRPWRGFTRPLLKTSTGLLALLGFRRKDKH